MSVIIAILSILLIINSVLSLLYLLKIIKLKTLLKDILYNLRRTEGSLSHDNLRICHCIKDIEKVIYE